MPLTEEVRDRRVAVAKDVLLQLGRADVPLRMSKASRLCLTSYINGLMLDVALDLSLKDQADTVQRTCTVCAMGALLLSKARLLDEIQMADVVIADTDNSGDPSEEIDIRVSRDAVCRLLGDTFDDNILDRVEAFFEDCPTNMDPADYYREGISAYAKSMPAPRDRMVEIAKNIVRNRGEFIVPAEHVEAGSSAYAAYGE